MVAIEIEMAKPGFAPVTPPKQVSMAPTSPVEAPGIELDEVPSAAEADGLQPGIGADEDALGAVSSGILDAEDQYREGLPDAIVSSPSSRLRSKAPSPRVLKRSSRYCQKEDGVFNANLLGKSGISSSAYGAMLVSCPKLSSSQIRKCRSRSLLVGSNRKAHTCIAWHWKNSKVMSCPIPAACAMALGVCIPCPTQGLRHELVERVTSARGVTLSILRWPSRLSRAASD